MTQRSRAALGRRWEDRAAEYLARQGLDILVRGYRCRFGEIDLVCRDEAALVFIEVRARSSRSRTRALESIDRRKQEKLIATARHFLMCHPGWRDAQMRFDVVAVDGIEEDAVTMKWLRNVIDC